MIHARSDYNERIQDSAMLIGIDEPVFLVRAKDVAAPLTVRAWARHNLAIGGDAAMSIAAEHHADLMEKWQQQNLNQVKIADAPDGAI